MALERIGAQAARLGLDYLTGMTVAAMKAAGFEVDAFIPDNAVYEPKRPDHNIVRRSEVADPDYVFAWTVLGVGWLEEIARETDAQILAELRYGAEQEWRRE